MLVWGGEDESYNIFNLERENPFVLKMCQLKSTFSTEDVKDIYNISEKILTDL